MVRNFLGLIFPNKNIDVLSVDLSRNHCLFHNSNIFCILESILM